MVTRSHRPLVVVLCLLACIATACSSGGRDGKSAPAIPRKWNPAAVKAVQSVGAKLLAAGADECADLTFFPTGLYGDASIRAGRPIPGAAGNCQAFGEDLEITAFKDRAARDAFFTKYTASLCQRSAKFKKSAAPFPGLPFVTGGTWAIQVDSEPGGRRAAQVLDGRYHFERCPGMDFVGWKDAPVTALEGLATKLGSAGLGCTDFSLSTKESLVPLPAYQPDAAGVPAALGRCTIGSGVAGGAQLVAFASTAKRDQFVTPELATRCAQSPQALVVGDDWAVFLSTPEVAREVATATGGTVKASACP